MADPDYEQKRASCAQRCRRRLGMTAVPELIVTTRRLDSYLDPENVRAFESAGNLTCEIDGYYNQFETLTDMMADDWEGLWEDVDLSTDLAMHLIKLRLMPHGDPEGLLDAGYKWDFIGTLKNGERFCAIVNTMTMPAFRGCGLVSLLKMDEIALARRMGCAFIHTYHNRDNPGFMSVIAPNLRTGFALVADEETPAADLDLYLHLRKHLSPGPPRRTAIIFADGARFVSPDHNAAIMAHLQTVGPAPGRAIARIAPLSWEADQPVKRTG